MEKHIQTTTVTAMLLLSLATVETRDAAALLVGKYAFSNEKLKPISLAQREQLLASLSPENKTLISATTAKDKALNMSNADKINQGIQDKYQGLVEESDEMNLVETQKILKSTDNEIGAEFNAGDVDNTQGYFILDGKIIC